MRKERLKKNKCREEGLELYLDEKWVREGMKQLRHARQVMMGERWEDADDDYDSVDDYDSDLNGERDNDDMDEGEDWDDEENGGGRGGWYYNDDEDKYGGYNTPGDGKQGGDGAAGAQTVTVF